MVGDLELVGTCDGTLEVSVGKILTDGTNETDGASDGRKVGPELGASEGAEEGSALTLGRELVEGTRLG